MGETTVNSNGVPMALGNGQGPRIRPAFKQRQRSGLNREIFAVQSGHQPELPPGATGLSSDPATLFCRDAQVQSLLISGEGLGLVSPDIARELVQQQNQCQS